MIRANTLADLFAPAVVDIFAGCGGWSIGAEQAFTGAGYADRYVDLMINHWSTAVGVHEANHLLTHHLHADVREVDPADVLPGRRIAYLHASPDCTDHSKAKGGKPRRKEIRALADVVIVWAAKRRPAVITLENVEEFQKWGPLIDWHVVGCPGDGKDYSCITACRFGSPDPARRGDEFRRWVGELRALGYVVDWRELRACDYGAPTTRKRLLVVARCDGKPIIWPEKTHDTTVLCRSGRLYQSTSSGLGEGVRRAANNSFYEREYLRDHCQEGDRRANRRHRADDIKHRSAEESRRSELKPFRTAASCIDWTLPMLSIFASPAEAKAFAKQHAVGTPRRPLKPKTLARIAGGLDKFVLRAARPFIVRCAHGDDSSGGPRWGKSSHDVAEPLPTVSGSKDFAIVGATLAPYSVPRYGERDGQAPRCQSIDQPAGTITGTANGTTLVAATLSTLNHGGPEHRGADIGHPIATVTGANDARALVAALVTKHYGGVRGSAADAPLDTVTGCDHNALTVAYLSHFYTSNSRGGEGDPRYPAKTVTSGGQHAAVTVALCSALAPLDPGSEVGTGLPSSGGDSAGSPNESRQRIGQVEARSANPGGDDDTVSSHERLVASGDAAHESRTAEHSATVTAPYLIGTGGAAYAAKPKAADAPANTVMVNDRRAIVAAFMTTYYGNGGATSPADPAPTVTGHDRIALVTVVIDGQTYVVTDIAMRMLTPRELARCQGFDDSYVIDRTADGRPVSKADQVKLIGNSVCPDVARAIVKANVVDQGVLSPSLASGGA